MWVRRSWAGSALPCCKAGPSLILGLGTPWRFFSCWAEKRWRYKKKGLGEWRRMNECMIVLCESLLKIINIKKIGIIPPNLFEKVIMWHHVWISPWSAAGSHNEKNREKEKKEKKKNQSIRQTVTSVQGPHGPVAPISQKLSSMLNGSRWEAGTPRLSQTFRTFSRGVNRYRLLAGNAKIHRNPP